ncbi:endonuclease/exonuclease/phosphatase family protein [Sphingopyxis flava]|uniref:Metal-dependent hydrolase, endonuclease/exonuclease/phosphatase family n=1 Tax=Sphingopyxis flava TaxID=1507287 RepID=A0A1T5EXU2_9SPHN|nr:endonuclease/exonuclease/phosphatase family protein [Sphingopyxis flava]SKB88763.1 Metal-dependent hydrolase, endonuclease/exonuclease/phosphatase family [Sphingopyxis flava]
MIKVASYNMRKGIGLDRRRDPARVLSVLRELDADVIALQEADRRFGTRASAIPPHMFEEHSDYVPVDLLDGRPYAIGWHGNAFLVRKGVEVEESHALHLPTLEPRGAIAATLRIGDIRLRVVGMHLDISGLRRRQQARAILAHVSDGEALPTILMGDCNEWRNRGGCLADFAEHHRLVDTGHSFHSRRPVAKLDRIFASPDLEAVEAGVHQSALAARASDHLPIWARFRRAD